MLWVLLIVSYINQLIFNTVLILNWLSDVDITLCNPWLTVINDLLLLFEVVVQIFGFFKGQVSFLHNFFSLTGYLMQCYLVYGWFLRILAG